MLFSRLVVSGRPLLKHPRQRLNVQQVAFGKIEQHLRHGQQITPIAVGQGQHGVARLGRQRQGPLHQGRCSVQQLIQRGIVQTLQHIDLAARQQRPVQLERRVLGRSPDQGDDPLLDEGQEAVLLGAVEAVDLVHEQQGLLSGGPAHPCRLERFLQVSDT